LRPRKTFITIARKIEKVGSKDKNTKGPYPGSFANFYFPVTAIAKCEILPLAQGKKKWDRRQTEKG